MSLEELPTELDAAIIDYLEQGDLTELCLVSKYYRQLAEPHLYDSIEFYNNHEDRVNLLLFTLIKRKDLRSSIHHFVLRHEPQAPWPEVPDLAPQIFEPVDDGNIDLCDVLMAHAPRITKLVSDLAHTYKINPHLKMEMFASVFDPYPHYDGPLALILCLITKVVSIELDLVDAENLPMTRLMLEDIKWTSGPSMYDHPFCALKKLRICGVAAGQLPYISSFGAVIHPAMQTLELCNNPDLRTIGVPQALPFQAAHFPGNLTTLTLDMVNFDPSILETLVSSPWCANLKALVVFGLGQNGQPDSKPWAIYDYTRLKYAMLRYIPRLQYFTWLDMPPDYSATPFGSFEGFKELKELLLDRQLFSGDTELGFREVQAYFPPSLKVFELSGMNLCLLDKVKSDHGIGEDDFRDFPRLMEAIQLLASRISAKEIMITMDLNCADPVGHNRCMRILDEPVIRLFRKIADALDSVGTTLTVWYRWDVWDRKNKLLVSPGLTTKVIRDRNGEIIQRSKEGYLSRYTSESEDEENGDRMVLDVAGGDDERI